MSDLNHKLAIVYGAIKGVIEEDFLSATIRNDENPPSAAIHCTLGGKEYVILIQPTNIAPDETSTLPNVTERAPTPSTLPPQRVEMRPLRNWTNSALRQKLGEAGFIQTNITPIADKADYVATVWERNGFLIALWEHKIHAPQLTDYRTQNPIDPDDLGVRNINTQLHTRP